MNIILEIVHECFSHLLETDEGHARMKEMIPSYDESLVESFEPASTIPQKKAENH